MSLSCDRSLAAPPSALPMCARPPTLQLPSHGAMHARPTPVLPLRTCHVTTAPPPHRPLHARPLQAMPPSMLYPLPAPVPPHVDSATAALLLHHLRPLHPASSARVWCWPRRSVPHPPAPPRAHFLVTQSHSVPTAQPYPSPPAEPLPHPFHVPPPPAHALLSSPSPHTRPNPHPHLHLAGPRLPRGHSACSLRAPPDLGITRTASPRTFLAARHVVTRASNPPATTPKVMAVQNISKRPRKFILMHSVKTELTSSFSGASRTNKGRKDIRTKPKTKTARWGIMQMTSTATMITTSTLRKQGACEGKAAEGFHIESGGYIESKITA
ncbi:hypothetical protein B0H14DRAFT_2617566 [Mycena olivaceomarginata]|nr:hypothetical protein B0H14DRAFT_2617566 [Mycena olivaceomarginata]